MKYLILIFALNCYCYGDAFGASSKTITSTNDQYPISKVSNRHCKLKVGWTSWKPYQYLDKQGKLAGLQIKLMTLIGQELGCEPIFHEYIWTDSVSAIKSGTIDLISNASINPDRQKFAYFSNQYKEDLVVLYVRSSDINNYTSSSLRDLFLQNNFKLGLLSGSVYDEELAILQTEPQFARNFVDIESTAQMIDALTSGKIDGYFEDPLIFDHSLEEYEPIPNIVNYSIMIKTVSLHYMFSKKTVDRDFVERFNNAMEKVKLKNREMFEWYEY